DGPDLLHHRGSLPPAQKAEVALLTRELAEALERQTATAEVLSVISRSPGDLKLVFDTMLETATRICRAEYGRLALYDGKAFKTRAVRGASPEYARFVEGYRQTPPPETAMARMVAELKAVHQLDAAASPGYLAGDPFVVAAVELGGARTGVFVPLIR